MTVSDETSDETWCEHDVCEVCSEAERRLELERIDLRAQLATAEREREAMRRLRDAEQVEYLEVASKLHTAEARAVPAEQRAELLEVLAETETSLRFQAECGSLRRSLSAAEARVAELEGERTVHYPNGCGSTNCPPRGPCSHVEGVGCVADTRRRIPSGGGGGT